MSEYDLNLLKKAGKLNFKTQKFAQKIIKVGCDLSKIGLEIDKFILDNEAVPSWPVNLSINHEAAHNTYDLENSVILKEDDVLKVDVGVSIDGFIADSAQTIIFNKKYEPLKQASINALLAVKKYLTDNYKTAKVSDVGEIIENKIKSSGFKPISNLTGHAIDKFVPHAYPSIPNTKNDLNIQFSEINLPFAIEPFVSTGDGFVTESDKILIFQHIEDRPIRNKDSKLILEEIHKYQGMPFSEYWVGKSLTTFQRRYALRELLKNEIISSFPVLVDRKDSLVSQAETTFLIDKKEGFLDLVNIDEL
jgi:methionyl aminopeptidase